MRNPYVSLLRTSWRYAREEKKIFVMIYSMFAGANLVAALNPLLYGWFIDNLQKDGVKVLEYAWVYVLAFFGLRLLEWAFHGPARVMERKLAFNISRNFLDEKYHQVLHLPVNWHQDNHSGTTINRLRKAYEALRNFFQNGFTHLYLIGKFFFSFVAMVYFSPLFGMIGVVIGAFTVWVIYKFDKPFIASIRECNEKEHKVYSNLFDSLSNIVTVITLRLEKRMEKSLFSKVMDVFPPWKKRVVINEWKWFVAQMLVVVIYGVITMGYIYQNYTPGTVFYIGGLVTLLGYVNQFTSVFNDVAGQYTQIVQYDADVQVVNEIEKSYEEGHRAENKEKLPVGWKNIEVRNLSFYRSNPSETKRKRGNLYDMSFQIQKGKKVALIGESGSGKSTMLALLRGLYPPETGFTLSVDGDNSPKFASIPNTVTLFPQEPEIFENTIHYNITLGLPFTDQEVLEVCETARFTEVVNQLPNGLSTHIAEKGVNLSGGQKQRLALARGILAARSSNIILFDEPTSSVDPRTESLIYNKLFHAFGDRAIVSSLHRLHLLPQFDYIYILQNGKIVDEGTFDDLLKNSTIFNEMWKHQKERVLPLTSGGLEKAAS